MIEDDEASVDCDRPLAKVDFGGMRMTPEAVGRFVQHNLVLASKQPRRDQSGDPASDDRNAH
jgi:hypothetical protein